MQIFLPYPDVNKSAQILDRQRLGKQRVEAKQILEINLLITHPEKYILCGAGHFHPQGFQCGESVYYKPFREWRESGGTLNWENHPAVRMMRGWEIFTCFYGWLMCGHWIKRGYEDNLRTFFAKTALELNPHIMAYFHYGFLPNEYLPTWLYREEFHQSHRAKLLAKKGMYSYYSQFFTVDNYQEITYEWNRNFWK